MILPGQMPLPSYWPIMPFTSYLAIMPPVAYSADMAQSIQNPSQLSAHLRSLRKIQGLTQAQLGAKVGLDQTRIAKIERDPGIVSLQQLLEILAALDVRLALEPRKPTVTKKTSVEW
jgi:HTH-type transcriptional regulator/antitoxin HipB